MPAGGGVAGQPVCAYLVGRRRFVLVDPGDPTGPGLDRAHRLAAERAGAIDGDRADPRRPRPRRGRRRRSPNGSGIPVLAGPGGGRPLPYAVRERRTSTGSSRRRAAPGRPDARTAARPPRLRRRRAAGLVIGGDLDGRRGARSVARALGRAAAVASRDASARRAGATWLPGHPAPATRPRDRFDVTRPAPDPAPMERRPRTGRRAGPWRAGPRSGVAEPPVRTCRRSFAILPVGWFFVLLALVAAGMGAPEAAFGGVIDPWLSPSASCGCPSVVAILLPAALLARHPDARSRCPDARSSARSCSRPSRAS